MSLLEPYQRFIRKRAVGNPGLKGVGTLPLVDF